MDNFARVLLRTFLLLAWGVLTFSFLGRTEGVIQFVGVIAIAAFAFAAMAVAGFLDGE